MSDIIKLEAKILAIESAVKAMAMTHPAGAKAFDKFNKIFPDISRQLNRKGTEEHSAIAKEFVAECNALSHYFPKA